MFSLFYKVYLYWLELFIGNNLSKTILCTNLLLPPRAACLSPLAARFHLPTRAQKLLAR